MRAFSVLQKWPKIAKMTPNDFFTLEIVLTEPPRNTKQNTLLDSQVNNNHIWSQWCGQNSTAPWKSICHDFE